MKIRFEPHWNLPPLLAKDFKLGGDNVSEVFSSLVTRLNVTYGVESATYDPSAFGNDIVGYPSQVVTYIKGHRHLRYCFDPTWSEYSVDGADFVRARVPGFTWDPNSPAPTQEQLMRGPTVSDLESLDASLALLPDYWVAPGYADPRVDDICRTYEESHYDLWYDSSTSSHLRLSAPLTKEWVSAAQPAFTTDVGVFTLYFKASSPLNTRSQYFNGWTDRGFGVVRFMPSGTAGEKGTRFWVRNDREIDLSVLLRHWAPADVPFDKEFRLYADATGSISPTRGRTYDSGLYSGPRWCFTSDVDYSQTVLPEYVDAIIDSAYTGDDKMWIMLIIWLVSYLLAGGTKSGQQGKAALAATAVTGAYYAGTQMGTTADLSTSLATDDCSDTATTSLSDGNAPSTLTGNTGISGFLSGATSEVGQTLRTWGPTGTLGVVAGTTALTSQSDYKWLWIALGVGAFFLVAK